MLWWLTMVQYPTVATAVLNMTLHLATSNGKLNTLWLLQSTLDLKAQLTLTHSVSIKIIQLYDYCVCKQTNLGLSVRSKSSKHFTHKFTLLNDKTAYITHQLLINKQYSNMLFGKFFVNCVNKKIKIKNALHTTHYKLIIYNTATVVSWASAHPG